MTNLLDAALKTYTFAGSAQIVLVERFDVSFYPGNHSLTCGLPIAFLLEVFEMQSLCFIPISPVDAVANTINNSVDASINAELTAYGLTVRPSTKKLIYCLSYKNHGSLSITPSIFVISRLASSVPFPNITLSAARPSFCQIPLQARFLQ